MNKRRPTISRILAVTCALSIFAGAFASAPSKPATFSDVQPGDWFYPYVTEMAELDAVSGFTDGTFRPGRTITAAEFVSIVGQCGGLEPAASSSSHWAAGTKMCIRDSMGIASVVE